MRRRRRQPPPRRSAPVGHLREQAALANAHVAPRSHRSFRPKTRSPTANSVTADADRLDLAGELIPRIRRLGRRSRHEAPDERLAARMWQSVWLTVVARTRTRTSSSFGTGAGTSSMRSTSGGPVPVVHDRSHRAAHRAAPPVGHGQDDVAGLLPRLDVAVASTTSSSGYVRSMTARYSPASMSSLRKRTSSFVYCGMPIVDPLVSDPPGRERQQRTCHMNPRSVAT